MKTIAKKRWIALALIAVILAAVGLTVAACGGEHDRKEFVYSIAAPDGAPALALVKSIGNGQADVDVVPGGQIAAAALKHDFTVLPANAAATLYNKGNAVKLLASVTSGNLYLVGSAPASGADELPPLGSRVYAFGQNQVPDVIFRTLLDAAGLPYQIGDRTAEDKVTITYVADNAAIVPMIAEAKKQGESVYGLMAEPAIAGLVAKGGYEIADLQALWQRHTGSAHKGFAQAVLIGRADVTQEQIDAVLADLTAGAVASAEDPAAAYRAVKSVYEGTVLPEKLLTPQAVARCNIRVISVRDSEENRAFAEKTLRAAFELDARIVGGKLPDDGFYFRT